jgi:serine/threonine-protein kinase
VEVESATRACELTGWKDAGFLDTLAAACAEAAEFDAAMKRQERALELQTEEKEREDARARPALYQSKTPYHRQPAAK